MTHISRDGREFYVVGLHDPKYHVSDRWGVISSCVLVVVWSGGGVRLCRLFRGSVDVLAPWADDMRPVTERTAGLPEWWP